MSAAAFAAQREAANPRRSVFVLAHAGSGKTRTLVDRVARLLLAGADPSAILCVTFTKAAAAEMQRRLFDRLGAWSVMDDERLQAALADIGEANAAMPFARALFARALETPGGLKIQTIHAFCEALLRRFPLEARLSPGFAILDDAAAAEISRQARETLAERVFDHPGDTVATAYASLSVELPWTTFEALFDGFAAREAALRAYLAQAETVGGFVRDTWRRCGFEAPASTPEIEAEAIARIRWVRWTAAIEALRRGGASDVALADALAEVTPGGRFGAVRKAFCTLGTRAIPQDVRDWLLEEQARCLATCERLKAAKMAEESVAVLTLASAYVALYEAEKARRSALDFGDVIARARDLLTVRADAAWVLYKLDGGLEHVLLDEAQDTSPEQWEILRALTGEFFTGLGAHPRPRTVLAVGDEKQSIFSFQGAAPERLSAETQAFEAMIAAGGQRLHRALLRRSFRSAPDILAFVDAVAAVPEVLDGLAPSRGNILPTPVRHEAHRQDAGCVELWPLESREAAEEGDVWDPVDAEPPAGPGRRLAGRIAREIRAAVARGDLVAGDDGEPRACGYGDFLVLVRRRNALFHEIIRALKREGVEVAGADRFRLAEHGVRDDLMAVGRVALFPTDDLSLACLLRGPFCDVSEESLFDLAHEREASLLAALLARAAEQPAWTAAADLVDDLARLFRAVPFDAYGAFLSRLDAGGRSMRQRLMTRMGLEGAEALQAFLAQALEAEGRGVRDLEGFLSFMALSDLEIKREAEAAKAGGRGAVRVMTAHGAKGLEAPIVILPDTAIRATDQGGALFEAEDGGFLWAPRKADDIPAAREARTRRAEAVSRESARLLYVALTRARDRLIIGGLDTQPHWKAGSWREHAERGFEGLESHGFRLADGADARRFGRPPPAAGGVAAEAGPAGDRSVVPLPDWVRRPAPVEAGPGEPTGPSRAGGGRSPAISPLARDRGLGRYRRGDLVHRLLQRLPDLEPGARAAAARVMLGAEGDLDEAQRAEIANAALRILEDPRFAPVFGPGSRAEVAIAGPVTPGRAARAVPVAGRVDRLVVGPDRVLVVDFKTDRRAPASLASVDAAYILQLALYAAVLKEIYPGRLVEAALVWTEGPRLMAVPPEAMAAALAALAGGAPAAMA
jgi:ATP-dependent helicase/nuclease subunit A